MKCFIAIASLATAGVASAQALTSSQTYVASATRSVSSQLASGTAAATGEPCAVVSSYLAKQSPGR